MAAYENYPLFSTLLRQAQRMVRREDTHLAFIQKRVSMHFKDSVQTMKEWSASHALEQKQKQLGADTAAAAVTSGDAAAAATAAATPSSDASSSSSSPAVASGRPPRFPLVCPPDVVYLDLYSSGQGGLIGAAALPFRIQVRARYLKMLCDVPAPAAVDAALDAALGLAASHVVMKFPMHGTHYRPGDVKPAEAQDAEAAATATATASSTATTPLRPWRVARIFKHKTLKCEFVVYQRIDSTTDEQPQQQQAAGEQ